MSLEVQQFDLSANSPLANEQLHQAYQALQQKYIKTLTEFNSFKESSILSYQQTLQKMDKNKSHNELLIKKLQKKYENLLHEQRTKAIKNAQRLRSQFEKQRSNFRQIINAKNQSIQNLSELLHKAEQQKSSIIEENTQNLINIVKSQENCLDSKKYSHTQLMKMYQFLLEENNCLKKQLIKVQITQDKSNSKSKKNKDISQILYTDQSAKIESMYISSQNQSQPDRKKPKSKQNSSSINMNASTVNESLVKASSMYKPKADLGIKKNKTKLSCHVNDTSVGVEENALKRKQTKKLPSSTQNPKKGLK